jgi:hypothetical protein
MIIQKRKQKIFTHHVVRNALDLADGSAVADIIYSFLIF